MASGCPTRYPLVKMFVEPGQIYLHCGHVDFRKSINGLLVIIEHELTLSPFTDAMFIFCNRNQDKLKIVYWDKTGFAMWYKVLQKDRFKWRYGRVTYKPSGIVDKQRGCASNICSPE